jgi:hypothetical protein
LIPQGSAKARMVEGRREYPAILEAGVSEGLGKDSSISIISTLSFALITITPLLVSICRRDRSNPIISRMTSIGVS